MVCDSRTFISDAFVDLDDVILVPHATLCRAPDLPQQAELTPSSEASDISRSCQETEVVNTAGQAQPNAHRYVMSTSRSPLPLVAGTVPSSVTVIRSALLSPPTVEAVFSEMTIVTGPL